MANVKMEELVRVQTVGPEGIGVFPPIPVEEVSKVSDAGLEMAQVQRSANVLPHPGAVDDGAVMQEKNDTWDGGSAESGGGGDTNFALGADLSEVFEDADALMDAIENEDYSKVHLGDVWPVTLNGSYYDYGNMTAPAGTKYYSDTSLTTEVGELASDVVPAVDNDNTVPGGHKAYVTVKVSNVDYYVAYADCLDYNVKTLTNAVMKFEVCGINQYWRYGDTGANNFHNGKPHLVLWSRDGLPTTLKMRKANELWEDTTVDTFTGDGTTDEFTLSGTAGTLGFVFVAGAKKTYNTDYTFANNKVTFKSGKIPANGAEIKIEWMVGKTPWTGSALYKTFNDPDHGIIKLIQEADPKLYAHIYQGPNSKGMRYYGETRNKTNNIAGAWEDRGLLFLPTEDEIWGQRLYTSANNASTAMTQWPLFVGGRRHFAKGAGNEASRAGVWSASSSSVTSFAYVYAYGFPNYTASTAVAAAPGFVLS